MVWRLLYRFFANDRVVDRLADWYPIRRAAQLVVYLINRTRAIEDKNISPEALKGLASEVEQQLKRMKENLEQKSKKY